MIVLIGSGRAITELDDIDSLVRVYRARLLRYVTYAINDLDLAETITQDCLLKAYRTRSSFRGECSVNTWLFGIANNLVRDHLRTEKFRFWRKVRATTIDLTDIALLESSAERSPEERLLLRERAEQVQRSLEGLSPNQRKVFVLKFLEDLDPGEISAVTGMPPNTVKTHLHRAVTAIRSQLGATR